jgi:prolyl-tRNA synthetase
MRDNRLLGKTLRDAPQSIRMPSYALLHRGGYIRQMAQGLFSFLPLGMRVLQNIQRIIAEEMDALGGQEIYMHDAYSFHRSYQDLNNFFPKTFTAYKKVFDRCGIEAFAGEAGVGNIGGEKSYEFLMPTDSADHAIILCDKCQYCASKEVAVGGKQYIREEEKTLEKVHTPEYRTIEELTEFLELPKERMAKSLVYNTPQGLVMAVVRGDYELGLEKLSGYLKYPACRPAGNEELASVGLVPGYLSPISVDQQVRVVVDDAVAKSSNLVFGANEEDYHLINGNFGRDFDSTDVTDISLTREEKNRRSGKVSRAVDDLLSPR